MVLEHWLAQFDGVIVARTDDVHYPLWTRNLATRYIIREADGREHVFHVDPAEGHRNGFPIGTRLTKHRWHMDYEEDGHAGNDFPPFYAFWMIHRLWVADDLRDSGNYDPHPRPPYPRA